MLARNNTHNPFFFLRGLNFTFIFVRHVLVSVLVLFSFACSEKPRYQAYHSQGFSILIPEEIKTIESINLHLEGARKVRLVYDHLSSIEIIAMIEDLPRVNPFGKYASGNMLWRRAGIIPDAGMEESDITPIVLGDEQAKEGDSVYKGKLQQTTMKFSRGEILIYDTERYQFARDGIVYTVIFDVEQRHIPVLRKSYRALLDSLKFKPEAPSV